MTLLIILSSEDGSLLYEFSSGGRHLRTFDTLTGQTLYTFSYNDQGYLTEIKNLDGEVTHITRDANNKPLAIIAPHGQTTPFTLDGQGYLASVTNPAQETYRLGFDQDGLLQTFTDPKQHQSTYRYNELGLLEEDTDAAGGGWQLARSKNTQGKSYTTTLTSKAGRVSGYQVKPQTNGDSLRVQIAPDGTQTQTLTTATGQTI